MMPKLTNITEVRTVPKCRKALKIGGMDKVFVLVVIRGVNVRLTKVV